MVKKTTNSAAVMTSIGFNLHSTCVIFAGEDESTYYLVYNAKDNRNVIIQQDYDLLQQLEKSKRFGIRSYISKLKDPPQKCIKVIIEKK